MLRQVAREPSMPSPLGEPGDRLRIRAPGDDAAHQLARITNIRLERLQDISDADLEAEGGLWREFHDALLTPREAFGRWWDSLHARPGTRWDDNPHVWAVAFQPALQLTRVADLGDDEREEIRALSRAVYPPEEWADWPGRLLEWADPEWCVRIRNEDGGLASYTGIVLRDGAVDGEPLRIGGVGGIKTHPEARGRGHARQGIDEALRFFREQADVAFALLVCEPDLVPYYAALGWTEFHGCLRVLQHGEVAEFTFNRVMTNPVRMHGPAAGTIDLRGAPW